MGDKCKTKPKINAEMPVLVNEKCRKMTQATNIDPALEIFRL
jgi:hypothetical protein